MLLANSDEQKGHLREVSLGRCDLSRIPSSPYSDYTESTFNHHPEDFKLEVPSEGNRFDIADIDAASPRNNWLPSPATTSDSPSLSVAESLLQDPKITTLPSFKELEALPIYIRAPQLGNCYHLNSFF